MNDDLVLAPAEIGCPICGLEACEDHVSSDSLPRTLEPRAFLPAAAVMSEPRPLEVIEGIAYAGRVTVLVSESGTGKTFVALSQAAAVSDVVSWCGRQTRPGSVAFLSYEGDALGLRMRALRDAQGHRLEHLYILRPDGPLSPVLDRDRIELPSRGEMAVRAALAGLRDELAFARRPPLVLLYIDTVRASLAGSEDASDNVAAYLRSVRRILTAAPGAAAILTHHAGWQDGEVKRKRERGSSALRGTVDATLYLEVAETIEGGDARLTLTALKVRDAERLAPLHLIRRRVELAEASQDLQHGPVTSCVIERDPQTRLDREAAQIVADQMAEHEADLRVLRLVAERPDLAASQDRLRVALGTGRAAVCASVARLVKRAWLAPPARQRLPYTVTPDGSAVLAIGATP